MGLKITSEIHTNKGVTSEMYLNIENLMLSKSNNNTSVILNKYLNKGDRDANKFDRCESYQISNMLTLKLDIGDLSSVFIYQLAYAKIKEDLESKGLTVEDLI
jgi:hypothetical protein